MIVPIGYGEGDKRYVALGARRGGRRYLSEDLHVLVLLCYKRSAPQKGQPGSWLRMWRAIAMRSVAIEAGLCRA